MRQALEQLSEEDLNMVTSFVLASGSIKALAKEYGVSYPTMRSRLDGLIERLQRRVEEREADPLDDYLAAQIARGSMSAETARQVRDIHRAGIERAKTNGLPANSTDQGVNE